LKKLPDILRKNYTDGKSKFEDEEAEDHNGSDPQDYS
jgi:hypothetical protein